MRPSLSKAARQVGLLLVMGGTRHWGFPKYVVGPGRRGEMLLCEGKQGLRGFPEPACKARLKE